MCCAQVRPERLAEGEALSWHAPAAIYIQACTYLAAEQTHCNIHKSAHSFLQAAKGQPKGCLGSVSHHTGIFLLVAAQAFTVRMTAGVMNVKQARRGEIVHNPLPQSSRYCVIIPGDDLHKADWGAQLGQVMTKQQFNQFVKMYMDAKNGYDMEEDAHFHRKQHLCFLTAALFAIPTLFASCCCWQKYMNHESPSRMQARQRAYALLQTFSHGNLSWQLKYESKIRKYICIEVIPFDRSARPACLYLSH